MVSITLNKTSGNAITQGRIYEDFLSNLTWLSDSEREKLISSSIEILENCVPPEINQISTKFNDTTGLVLGYVQSGKTLSFTSVMALACDNGYRVAILIAGRTNLLLNQNTKRLKKDIGQYDSITVSKNESGPDFAQKVQKRLENSKNRMLVVTVLKHQDHIKKLAEVFSTPELNSLLRKKSLLMFDDESDQASLNTYANSNRRNETNRESAIYSSIKYLRSKLPNHSYIQYTATPQANLLIDYLDLLSPDWHVLIYPGKKYTGGTAFFNPDYPDRIINIPEDERFHYKENPLNFPPKGLKDAIYRFIFSSIFLCYEQFKLIDSVGRLNKTSLMIHPCYRKKSINKFYKWTIQIFESIHVSIKNQEFLSIKKHFDNFISEYENLFLIYPNFEDIIDVIYNDFFDNYKVHEVVGDTEQADFPWDEHKHHILVGGQLLDRGFTVEDLIVTYMPRDTKGKNNADTIEQRCRFFGYKKEYLDFCKLYLPSGLKSDYESYVNHEIHLRDVLKKYSMSEFKRLGSPMLIKQGLNLTNKSRLSNEILETSFSRFKYFHPPLNFKKNNEQVEQFLQELQANYLGELKPNILQDIHPNNTHKVYETNKDELLKFLHQFDLGNAEENMQKSHIERLIANSDDEIPDKIFIIEIAHKRTQGRPRTIRELQNHRGNPYEISSLASNYPSYFGDSKLLKTNDTGKTEFNYTNNLIIQIHKIYGSKDTPLDSIYFGESFYTLGFSYPENINTIITSKLL